jgi:hypothetical protein
MKQTMESFSLSVINDHDGQPLQSRSTGRVPVVRIAMRPSATARRAGIMWNPQLDMSAERRLHRRDGAGRFAERLDPNWCLQVTTDTLE